jgi:hypothetical protein
MEKKDKGAVMRSIMVVVVIAGVGLLSGCTSPTDNTSSNASVSYPVLSATDGSLLEDAYSEYQSFRQSMSSEDARVQLLDSLNNHSEGIGSAVLGVDGYTIFVTYSDGDFVAVNTYEDDEEPSGSTGLNVLPSDEVPSGGPSQGLEAIRFDAYPSDLRSSSHRYLVNTPSEYNIIMVGPQQKTTCESKKVLVLGPCYWQFPRQPTDECIALFRQYGWPEEDIAVKLVTLSPAQENTDCLKLTPDDYFNLQDFGIILFPGHGAVGALNNFEETNVYMQFCYLNNASFVNNPVLKEWERDKKLLVSDRYRTKINGVPQFVYMTMIRADLLRQKISRTLPSSYLCFATCYGEYLGKVFLDKGGKVFVGWNNRVRAEYADENMRSMLQIMLENRSSVLRAYENPAIVKAYSELDPWHPVRGLLPAAEDEGLPKPTLVYNVQFHILPDPVKDSIAGLFYLPSWMNLRVTGIPAGTSSLQVSVYDSRGVLLVTGEQAVDAGRTELGLEYVGDSCFPPAENITIVVQPFDMNQKEISSRQTTLMLNPGTNEVSIALGLDLWTLSGSADDPQAPIDSVSESARLNGESLQEVNNYYPWFRAVPGDSLRIFYMTNLIYGQCYHMGPIWLHCPNKNFKVKLTDGFDFGCYYGEVENGIILYDETFTIPEP